MNESIQQLQAILADPIKGKLLILLLIWSFIWKGIALWKSGRNNQMPWFIVILLLNTVGILEIVYIGFFQKKK
ncbi:MAG: hypothetical protein UT33_C0018G0010 [Candidatus Peregrinibacteria bacterium GW2011_GWC2_39_14]|nr:MAG: hypothetical protein US92_C0003G0019 [Candidatus Peregrinibacteria bacterium GW2011_GWA2_38_36]KKR04658.1 MAG: hypothetical protein UT33_C0018G0010 [Candidatus Peregrinibacteria bacterium GW2011_GWC2_39_14]